VDLDNGKYALAQKEKQLETAKTNAELISKNLQTTNQEITELKGRLKETCLSSRLNN